MLKTARSCHCQFFGGSNFAKLFWCVNEPEGEFFTKDLRYFIQDPKNPAHLINHDNDYLHYKDDWYILDAEKDSHFLVDDKGSNDAWGKHARHITVLRVLPPHLPPWPRGPTPHLVTQVRGSSAQSLGL